MRLSHFSDREYIITDFTLRDILNRKYCVFDLEATGPDHLNDCITQIGAVILGDDGSVVDHYESFVRPPKAIPELIEKLTGIRNEDVEHARPFLDVIDEFLAFVNGCVLVTQAGYEYDLPLLREECRRNSKSLDDLIVMDTKAMFSNLHPAFTDIVSTNFLIRYYSIDDTDIRRHNALEDSILIARIFNKTLNECLDRGIQDIRFDNLKVKKVKLTPLI